jgi:drug/metabolite transporter (DMT)-like permease
MKSSTVCLGSRSGRRIGEARRVYAVFYEDGPVERSSSQCVGRRDDPLALQEMRNCFPSSGHNRSLAARFGENALAVDTQIAMVGRTRAMLWVASAGILWSTVGLGVRLMEDATAWQIVFYRGLFQAIAVTGLVLHRYRGRIRQPLRRIGWAGVVGAVALGVAYNGMIVALTLTSVATVVFILSAAPLMTGLLGWWVLREPVRPTTFAAMGLALFGILVMTFGELSGGHWIGSLAALFAVLGYSVFTVALRKGKDVDMLPTIALSGVVAALTSAVAIDSFAMTGRDLALSIYLGAVVLAVGLAMFTAGSRYLTSAELPLAAMTEPVMAPLWVWMVLGESVSVTTLLGGAIVLASVLLQGFFGTRRNRISSEITA